MTHDPLIYYQLWSDREKRRRHFLQQHRSSRLSHCDHDDISHSAEDELALGRQLIVSLTKPSIHRLIIKRPGVAVNSISRRAAAKRPRSRRKLTPTAFFSCCGCVRFSDGCIMCVAFTTARLRHLADVVFIRTLPVLIFTHSSSLPRLAYATHMHRAVDVTRM